MYWTNQEKREDALRKRAENRAAGITVPLDVEKIARATAQVVRRELRRRRASVSDHFDESTVTTIVRKQLEKSIEAISRSGDRLTVKPDEATRKAMLHLQREMEAEPPAREGTPRRKR